MRLKIDFTELPGLVLAGIIVDRAGRKLSLTIMLILVFICILPLAMLQSNILITGLLVGARMFAFGAFTIACIFTPEVSENYPLHISFLRCNYVHRGHFNLVLECKFFLRNFLYYALFLPYVYRYIQLARGQLVPELQTRLENLVEWYAHL